MNRTEQRETPNKVPYRSILPGAVSFARRRLSAALRRRAPTGTVFVRAFRLQSTASPFLVMRKLFEFVKTVKTGLKTVVN